VSELTKDETARLLRAAAAGDRMAYKQIYVTHQPYLRRSLASKYHTQLSAQDVEDIVQNLFLKLWEDLREDRLKYDPRLSGLMTWLTLQANNRAIDALRKKQVRHEFDNLPHVDDDGDEWNPYQELIDFTLRHVESVEISEWIERCLAGLSEREREAVNVRLDKTIKIKEYVRLHGLADSTFRCHANTGFAKLMDCLSPLDPSEERHDPS